MRLAMYNQRGQARLGALLNVRTDGTVPLDGPLAPTPGLQFGQKIHFRLAALESPRQPFLAFGPLVRADEDINPVFALDLGFAVTGDRLGRGVEGEDLAAMGEGDQEGLHRLHDFAVEVLLKAQVA